MRGQELLGTIQSAAGEVLAVDRRPKLNDRLLHRILRSDMTEIVAIRAREVLDSRGNPTVEADVILESGAMGRAIVPSGASTGEHEAVELRDGDKSHYMRQGRAAGRSQRGDGDCAGAGRHGRGQPAAHRPDDDRAGRNAEQEQAGRECDSRGLNGRARAVAQTLEVPLYRYLGGVNASVLPTPMLNVLNGGAHADSNVDFQEFMIMPGGRGALQRGAALGGGDVPHAEGRAEEEGLQHRRGRRGRICAVAEIECRSHRADP